MHISHVCSTSPSLSITADISKSYIRDLLFYDFKYVLTAASSSRPMNAAFADRSVKTHAQDWFTLFHAGEHIPKYVPWSIVSPSSKTAAFASSLKGIPIVLHVNSKTPFRYIIRPSATIPANLISCITWRNDCPQNWPIMIGRDEMRQLLFCFLTNAHTTAINDHY